VCTLAGARLCTARELRADAARGTGCGLDLKRVWSQDACPLPDAGGFGYLTLAGSTLASARTAEACRPPAQAGPAVRCCADHH